MELHTMIEERRFGQTCGLMAIGHINYENQFIMQRRIRRIDDLESGAH
jgi:hypothetical protein